MRILRGLVYRGGSLGIGGVIGALAIAVFSKGFKSGVPQRLLLASEEKQRTAQATLILGLTCMAAKVAQSDGEASPAEFKTLDTYLKDSLGLNISERQTAKRVFDEAVACPTPASQFALQLGDLFRKQHDRLRDVLTILFAIARTDAPSMHPEEEDLIRRIARDMGLTIEDHAACRAVYQSSVGDADACPYGVLGVSPSASDQEVRSAHRRVVREYHPDVLSSKGLPDELLAFAQQKLILTNDAWATIKAQRGRLEMPG